MIRLLVRISVLFVAVLLLASAGVLLAWRSYSAEVPDLAPLRDVQWETPSRVLAADGQLLAVFGENRRAPVGIDQVPANLVNALLAAEDTGFYAHHGVSLRGTVRAAWHNLRSGGKREQGGSTLTQQVARNFLLDSDKNYRRKILEVLAALRIEKEFSKDEILELYLNKMFLGHHNYGIGAAARYYYNKRPDELSLAESAMIAASFQAPSVVNPLDGGARARARRDWVLQRMLEHGFVSARAGAQALRAPMSASGHAVRPQVDAGHAAEMARKEALRRAGPETLRQGVVIRTTIDPRMQRAAQHALRRGLDAWALRHHGHDPEARIEMPARADAPFCAAMLTPRVHAGSTLLPALVLAVADREAELCTLQPGNGDPETPGPVKFVRIAAAELQAGDIVRVHTDASGTPRLTALPAAEGAVVAIDPHDGAIRALVGSYAYARSNYNRATMPEGGRQPGSTFKPFLYAAALDNGFTPASILDDAPIEVADPQIPGKIWRPSNSGGVYFGPLRLRPAFYQSSNVVAVRLAQALGVEKVRTWAKRFGFTDKQLPGGPSIALGAGAASPLDIARGYAAFANGGQLIGPYLVSSIESRAGDVIYAATPPVACPGCAPAGLGAETSASTGSAREQELAPRILPERTAWLITSLMRDVIDRGTGHAATTLGRSDLAGKTGSTDDFRDAWFAGFNAAMVAAVWVGRDDDSTLGDGEFGARAALPIWMEFMDAALSGSPRAELPRPAGLVAVHIDPVTGRLANPDDPEALRETLRAEDLVQIMPDTIAEPAIADKPAEDAPPPREPEAPEPKVFGIF